MCISIIIFVFSALFMKNIIGFDISILLRKPYIYFSIAAIILFIIHLFISAKHLYVIADHTEAYLKSISEKSTDIYYSILKTDIEIISKKLDILKSFSPISVIVFLIGFFIDKSKLQSLETNIFFIITIGGVIIYFITLYDNFQLYKINIHEYNSNFRNKHQDNQSAD